MVRCPSGLSLSKLDKKTQKKLELLRLENPGFPQPDDEMISENGVERGLVFRSIVQVLSALRHPASSLPTIVSALLLKAYSSQ